MVILTSDCQEQTKAAYLDLAHSLCILLPYFYKPSEINEG